MAKVLAVGQAVNDGERQAIKHLRESLPDGYTIIHNFEMRVARQVFEIDIAVIAPHAIYLMDVKSLRGEIHVHGGKWYPESGNPFYSPLAKLRQHAKELKVYLVGNPERGEMKKVWVDSVTVLTDIRTVVNDPANVDAPSVTYMERIVAFLQDKSRLPVTAHSAPNLLPLHGRIISLVMGGARPPSIRDTYSEWKIEERLGGTLFFTEYRAYNRFAGPASGRVNLRVYETDPYLDAEARSEQGARIATAYIALNRLPAYPSIPTAKGFFQDETTGRYVLITEEAPGRALRMCLKQKPPVLHMAQKIRIVRDVLDALAHLHAHGVLHRAINPGTLIMGPDGRTRLTDFDFARTKRDHRFSIGSEVYKKTEDDAYLAPEIYLDSRRTGSGVDIYAAATVFYEMFTGDKLFPSMKVAVDRGCYIAARASHKDRTLPEGIDAWLQAMCALEPADRPDAGTALREFEAIMAPFMQVGTGG